jgi:hypothetical protein
MAIKLRMQTPDIHIIFGCVCYRDPVDSPSDKHQVHQLEEDIDQMVSFLATVPAMGGGDGPEDWVGGYGLALDAIQWRNGAKTIIHIADAPAHGARFCGEQNHEDQTPLLVPLIQQVAMKKIVVSCIDLGGGARHSFDECKAIYDAAGGAKWTNEAFTSGQSYGDSNPIADCMLQCARGACFDALTVFYG